MPDAAPCRVASAGPAAPVWLPLGVTSAAQARARAHEPMSTHASGWFILFRLAGLARSAPAQL